MVESFQSIVAWFSGLNVEGWLGVFTGALVVVGIAQASIYALMHRTTKAIERAWVHVETLNIEPPVDRRAADERGDRTIAIGLKNSGRTPARIVKANVTVRGTKEILDEGGGRQVVELDDIPDDPDYDEENFAAPGILAAGEFTRFRHRVGIGVNNENLATVEPGQTANIWIYGYIHYTDRFTPRKIRKYRWARRYDPVLSARSDPPRFRFAHINKPKYYEAD
jgi:hypothetical protein